MKIKRSTIKSSKSPKIANNKYNSQTKSSSFGNTQHLLNSSIPLNKVNYQYGYTTNISLGNTISPHNPSSKNIVNSSLRNKKVKGIHKQTI